MPLMDKLVDWKQPRIVSELEDIAIENLKTKKQRKRI